jgi:hypothetical protein
VAKGASTGSSRSQNLDPTKEPGFKEAVGSRLLEPFLGPKPQVGFQLLKAASGPKNQEVVGSQLSEAVLDPGGQVSPGPEPMEVYASDPSLPPPLERVPSVQRSVYYISEVLHDAKTRYLEVDKLFYAVLIASRKLRHSFLAHKISVVTSYPLRVVLHNPNATSNIAKCVAELAEFELDFIPCYTVISQVLANFMANWTPPPCHPGGPDDGEPEPRAPVFTKPHCTLFFNSSLRKQGARAGVLLLTLNGEQFKYMVHLDFKATKNMVEYEALIFGLSTVISLGVRQLLVKGGS